MKTINFLFTAVFVLLLGACTNENQPIEEDLAATDFRGSMAQEQQETQEVFELDLQQYYVLGEIVRLGEQKRKLEEEIERGGEQLIPEWESTVKLIHSNTEIFADILKNTCSYLKIRKAALTFKVLQGDKNAKSELEQVNQELEKCGKEADDYVSELIIPSGAHLPPPMGGPGGSLGGNCMPGRDYKCKHMLDAGTLLINSVDGQDRIYESRFVSAKGSTISKGKEIGNHNELKGVTQIAIDLESIENGKLQFVKRGMTYEAGVIVE